MSKKWVHQGHTPSTSSSCLPAMFFFFCAFTGGRVLFAGTDTGCIRAYKYPLNGDFLFFLFFYANFFFCAFTGGMVLSAGTDKGFALGPTSLP